MGLQHSQPVCGLKCWHTRMHIGHDWLCYYTSLLYKTGLFALRHDWWRRSRSTDSGGREIDAREDPRIRSIFSDTRWGYFSISSTFGSFNFILWYISDERKVPRIFMPFFNVTTTSVSFNVLNNDRKSYCAWK